MKKQLVIAITAFVVAISGAIGSKAKPAPTTTFKTLISCADVSCNQLQGPNCGYTTCGKKIVMRSVN